MNPVTKSNINISSKYNPSIDLEINGTAFSIPFYKSLHFFRPSNTTAIPVEDSSANSLDLRVHKSTWWIVTDLEGSSCSELASKWAGKDNGFQIVYTNNATGMHLSFRVTEQESNEISDTINIMMLNLIAEGATNVTKGAISILKPASSLLQYRVRPVIVYKRNLVGFCKESGTRLTTISEFNKQNKKVGVRRPFIHL